MKLDNFFPLSVNFSDDGTKIAINTSNRRLLLLEIKSHSLMTEINAVAETFWSSWTTRYPLLMKNPLGNTEPIALAHRSNLTAAGDENGIIYLWKNVESIKDVLLLNYTGHASIIQQIRFLADDSRLFTLGKVDNCLL